MLCSAVGYWSEYTLLKEFGLNIVVFAEANDFFMAGLKSPKIFIFSFPFFAIALGFISFKINRLAQEQQYITREELEISRRIEMAKLEKHNIEVPNLEAKQREMKAHFKHKLSVERRRLSLFIIPIILVGVTSIFILLQMELNNNLTRTITNPDKRATILLRTGASLPENNKSPLVFITATEKFMFFYQHDTVESVSTIAVPISSIASVVFSNFKILEIVEKEATEDKPSNK